MAAAITSRVRARSMPVFGSRLKEQQLDTLQQIVTKHIEDPALKEIASTEDFQMTTNERGISHYEHGHLVAALDTLNTYQRERRAKSKMRLVGHRAGMQRSFRHDPRTRAVELLKRWLRNNAAASSITEDEVRRMSGVCRDIMNNPTVFPARNARSFMQTIAEVYQHLDVQLREVLERDRTCAELAHQVLSFSRNLISDAVGYLLVGPTDLKGTDELPSLEVASLWRCLPTDSHPLPGRIDPKMQRSMRDIWQTSCGTLLANLLQTRCCVRLFEGAGAQEEAAAASPRTPRLTYTPDISSLIESIRAEFNGTSLKNSGLAGSFRKSEQIGVRMEYIAAVEVLMDLTYLIGEALVQFHRISDGLGDYGMIRVATWLHPFLKALTEKVLQLKGHLESLNRAVDDNLVIASARGYAVEKPKPSQLMGKRAHLAIERAVIKSGSHSQSLLQAIEDLRQRSSPDRLPQVVAGIGNACLHLDAVLTSPDFRKCVGDHFPNLPRITDVANGALGQGRNQIMLDVTSTPSITDVTEIVEANTLGASALGTIHSLRATASPQCDAPEVDFLESFTPRSHTTAQSFHASQNGASLRVAEDPSTLQGAAMVPSPPQEPPKVFGQKAQPLQMERCLQRSIAGKQDEVFTILPLHANVFRLTTSACGPGFRRHDRRALRLKGGFLDIFEKSSLLKVKTSLDVRCDVEECYLLPDSKRLSLVIRKLPKGAEIDAGVWTSKSYFFEFASVDEALSFHNEMSRLLSLAM